MEGQRPSGVSMEQSAKEPVAPSFSFEPETIGAGPDGQFVVVDSNHYVMLHSLTQGAIYYTAKDNKYWLAPGKECPENVFKTKFLPYIRWKYDVLEEEIAL